MVAAILIHYSGIELTQACLQDIVQLDPSPQRIIVVCNGVLQDDDSRIIMDEFDTVEVVIAVNKGFAAAVNEGIARAKQFHCDFVWVLNNDLRFPDKNVLQLAIKALNSAEDIAAVSVKMCYLEQPQTIQWAGGEITDTFIGWPTGQGEADIGQFNSITETTWCVGANMLVPMRVFDKVGLMDEEYFLYMEDVDWSIRANRLGYRCLCVGTTTVLHHMHASTAAVREYYFPRARILFVGKNFPHLLGRSLRQEYNHNVLPALRSAGISVVIPSLKPALSALKALPLKVFVQGIKDMFGSGGLR